MANDTQPETHRTRLSDKHNVYLPYLRELGAMAILAGTLYGVWDVFKAEGRFAIEAVEKQTAVLNNLVSVQTSILNHLKRQEDNRNVYRNPGAFGPPYVRDRDRIE